jgi:hypothetical protein
MPQHQHIYLGLDLGKRKDFTALALLEYSHPYIEYRNPVYFNMEQEFEEPRYAIRQLDRIPLGTKYIDVVEEVRAKLFKITARNLDCTLIVDATGVGQPVMELFHHLPARATLVPVVITAGTGESRTGDEWRVAKQDLVAGLQIMLETGQLQISNQLAHTKAFLEELLEFRGKTTSTGNEIAEGPQDDLVIAAALAVWRARQSHQTKSTVGFQNTDLGLHGKPKTPSVWGKVRLF